MTFKYTKAHLAFIETGYKIMSLAELTTAFNAEFNLKRKESSIRSATRNHGFKSGRTGQFKKGQTSWNKDTKSLTSANATSFKKGSVPKNRKPIGSERICSKDGYVLIKVAEKNPYNGQPTRYKHKHVVVWESFYGPIPKGMVVSFIDGDKTNCAIENLELLTRAELVRLNQMGFMAASPEERPTIRLMAKITTKAFTLEKELSRA